MRFLNVWRLKMLRTPLIEEIAVITALVSLQFLRSEKEASKCWLESKLSCMS